MSNKIQPDTLAAEVFNETCVHVRNKNYTMYYTCPKGKQERKKWGRSLKIKIQNASFTLNGTQINTLKKILKAAGEI